MSFQRQKLWEDGEEKRMSTYQIDYERLLDCIDPSQTNHDEWIRVGMALHYEGCSFDLFDSWSAKDTREGQYKGTEYTLRVWNSFQGSGSDLVTGATLTEMARNQGMDPFLTKSTYKDEFFGWDDEILFEDEEVKKKSSPPPFRPNKKEPFQIIDYLEACFKPDDYINIIPNALEEDGKYRPYGVGLVTIKVSEYVEDLRRTAEKPEFFSEVFGNYTPEAGVWIRVNPVTGKLKEGQKGIRDKDITRFENALVECDTLPLEDQLKKIKELNLPYKALVYSGGKSIHAVVRVDAKNSADYQDRVKWLYEYCHTYGFPVDDQTKNPSRMSRLPGCNRGTQKQFLIETAKPISFDDFKKTAIAEQEANQLPLICLESMRNPKDRPPLAEPLIEGLVRRGHKLIISGPSKAGKSFALISLAVAVAEGKEWMGFKCQQGKVLYLNFEIDGPSFIDRMFEVYQAYGWPQDNLENMYILNLRGRSEPLNLLTPRLEALLKKTPVDLVVIDPIYKVITGDENKANEMGQFCNLFDKIALAAQSTVAYCHHHSKGSQAQKAAIDRASGSGVFARDPDAIIDMTEIGFNEGDRKELKSRLMESIDDAYLKASGQWDNLANNFPNDLKDRIAKQLHVDAGLKYTPEKRAAYEESIAQAKELGECPAYRLNFTLREFKSPEDQNVFFKYPRHIVDPSGYLSELYLVGDNSTDKLQKQKEKADKRRSDEKREWYDDQREAGEMVSISDMAKEFSCVVNTVKKWIDDQEDLKRENGWILRKEETAPPMKKRGKGK